MYVTEKYAFLLVLRKFTLSSLQYLLDFNNLLLYANNPEFLATATVPFFPVNPILSHCLDG